MGQWIKSLRTRYTPYIGYVEKSYSLRNGVGSLSGWRQPCTDGCCAEGGKQTCFIGRMHWASALTLGHPYSCSHDWLHTHFISWKSYPEHYSVNMLLPKYRSRVQNLGRTELGGFKFCTVRWEGKIATIHGPGKQKWWYNWFEIWAICSIFLF